MKRVRHLAGTAGLAPMVLGAVAGGGAHAAAAEVAGHAKTVSAHAALGHQGLIPDINRVTCSRTGDWLRVFQSNFHEICFANAGSSLHMKVYRIDSVYTGNNRFSAHLSYGGRTYTCYDSHKNTWINASSCTSHNGAHAPFNAATMVYLRIF